MCRQTIATEAEWEKGAASSHAAIRGVKSGPMAGATLAFIPMLLIFLFFQDYFIKGITVGAVKG